jgi:LacI family transcriptional regulator
VVRALRFIQQRAFQDIVVKDILHEVPVSRRSLEIQFRRYLGRSPAEEIRRVRLEKGRELLARTDMSIGEIASACGFANGTRFGVAFRKRFGKTPLAYRKQLTRS